MPPKTQSNPASLGEVEATNFFRAEQRSSGGGSPAEAPPATPLDAFAVVVVSPQGQGGGQHIPGLLDAPGFGWAAHTGFE